MLASTLIDKLIEFRHARDWEQFHNLRTLSTSLALECAELQEFTQWTPDAELAKIVGENKSAIEEEVADIAILLTYLVHDLGMDLDKAVEQKLRINGEKYPIAKSKGVSTKYDKL